MKNRIYRIISLFAVLLTAGCEDMLDTYDEYAGDGVIHYVGKCSNVDVVPGWERLRVTWKDALDANIDSIKISCQAETDATPRVYYKAPVNIQENSERLDTLWIEGLSDALYTIRVSAISGSEESIVEEKYGRPYTANHEDLRAFARGITNFYPMSDYMAVVVEASDSAIHEATLSFWDTEGNPHEWNIKNNADRKIGGDFGMDFGKDNFFLLPRKVEESIMPGFPSTEEFDPTVKIDFQKPIIVNRKGMLETCLDTIIFPGDTLQVGTRVWSAEFAQLMTKKYGENWESQIDNLTEIELDYDITSFKDLCYLPKLEKVVLGKNRYLPDGPDTSKTDNYSSLMALQFLKNTRENFTVERYNAHYFTSQYDEQWGMYYPWLEILSSWCGYIDADLVTEMGDKNLALMPQVTPLDVTGWKITCSDTTCNDYKANGAGWLLKEEVNMLEACFEPRKTMGAQIVTVEFNMGKLMEVKGFKVIQPGSKTQTSAAYRVGSVKVEVSTNGIEWEKATHEDGATTIGDAPGEITFIDMPTTRSIQYIRLTFSNQSVETTADGISMYTMRLGAFIPYR